MFFGQIIVLFGLFILTFKCIGLFYVFFGQIIMLFGLFILTFKCIGLFHVLFDLDYSVIWAVYIVL